MNSPDFDYVVQMAGHDEDRVREAFERLSKFAPEMRRELMRDMVQSVMSIKR